MVYANTLKRRKTGGLRNEFDSADRASSDQQFSLNESQNEFFCRSLIKDLNDSAPLELQTKLVAALSKVDCPMAASPRPVQHTKWISGDVALPFQFSPKTDVSFMFVPPERVVALPFDTGILAVIPSCCFDKNDFLNHIYWRKRILYLAVLGRHLLQSLDVSVRFQKTDDSSLRFALCVSLPGDDQHGHGILIFAAPEQGVFKLSRFSPANCNVFPDWLLQNNPEVLDFLEAPNMRPATPYHNQLLLSDFCFESVHVFFEHALSCHSNLAAAYKLAKIWLENRDLDFVDVKLLLLSVLVHMIRQNDVSSDTSILRGLLRLLSALHSTTLSADNIDFCDTGEIPGMCPPSLSDLKCFADMVIRDQSGYYNLAYSLHTSMLNRISVEAGIALKILEKGRCVDLVLLFQQNNLCTLYDCVLTIKNIETINDRIATDPQRFSDSVVDSHATALTSLSGIHDILSRGLGERITHLHYVRRRLSNSLTFGITINKNCFDQIVTRGPAGNDKKALRFRELWGSLSELRKFPDGVIAEAVLWNAKTAAEKRLILPRAVEFLLERHFEIQREAVSVFSTSLFDSFLQSSPNGTGEEEFDRLSQASDRLTKLLRSLDLPLSVRSIVPLSATLRDTSPFPPRVTSSLTRSPFIPVNCVLIDFETSSAWPFDSTAIRTLLSAMQLKLTVALRRSGMVTYTTSSGGIDTVVVVDGFIFSVKVVYQRQSAHRAPKNKVSSEVAVCSRPVDSTVEFQAKHASIILGFVRRFGSFGSTCRIAKRWLHSHMIDCYFLCDEIVELIVAYLYLERGSYAAEPSSVSCYFIRFLQLLSTHNWLGSALIVNLDDSFGDEDLKELENQFASHRPTLPPMCVCTPIDRQGTSWTRTEPTAVILDRIVSLARASLDTIQTGWLDDVRFIASAFVTPLDAFDLLVRVKHRYTSQWQSPAIEEANIVSLGSDPLSTTGAVLFYVRELRRSLNSFAYFFVDSDKPEQIGVVWKMKAFHRKQIAASQVNGRRVDVGRGLTADFEAIIQDIKLIGDGIVASVTISKESDCR